MREFKLMRFRWKNRLLLLFSPSTEDEVYLSQMEDIQGKEAEIEERDLIIGFIFSKSL